MCGLHLSRLHLPPISLHPRPQLTPTCRRQPPPNNPPAAVPALAQADGRGPWPPPGPCSQENKTKFADLSGGFPPPSPRCSGAPLPPSSAPCRPLPSAPTGGVGAAPAPAARKGAATTASGNSSLRAPEASAPESRASFGSPQRECRAPLLPLIPSVLSHA